jgi:hypothetical protein
MTTLTQLLGNRELAFEDNLEKGRIWVYSEGNMYTGFCNGFCWKPPGTGTAVIEIWGAAGSGAKMCCCGAGLPGNPPAYVKKTVCVCPSNYVCGYVGRSCNNSDSLCFRGCSESTCVCWFGCSPLALYESGTQPKQQNSWKGNNPWGWGSGSADPITSDANWTGQSFIGTTEGNFGANNNGSGFKDGFQVCRAAGATNGCLCAHGGKGGLTYCMDDKSPYSCFITGGHCGTRMGPRHNMCDTARSACGMICNICADGGGVGWIACGYGGDLNCCGGWSCVSFAGCLEQCQCLTIYHHAIAAGIFADEGGVASYTPEGDSPFASWAGAGVASSMNAMMTMSRAPTSIQHTSCWANNRACGCYQMQGCYQFVPYGMPGAAAHPCGEVRDQAGRGGMGNVRIKYIPNEGGSSY